MSKSKTVQVTPEEVAEALKQRIPVKDIAALHGCSERTISRKAAVAGLADEARRISFLYGNNPQLREVKEAFHKRIGPEELANLLSISKESAAHQLQVAIELFNLHWQGICEQCGVEFNEFSSMGRFCTKSCARSFSTRNLTEEQKAARNAPLVDPTNRAKAIRSSKQGSRNRIIWSDEAKAQQSERLKTFWATHPEAKEKLSKQVTGRETSSATRTKLSIACREGH